MVNTAFKALIFGAFMVPTIAFSGDQYLDRTGYAVSGYDVVAYFDLKQAPVGQKQPKAVRGDSMYTAKYNGATWAFSSAANRKTFLANPAAYAPQYDGHCAYGVAVGNKVPANPHLWRIKDGKLFLNITRDVNRAWERNIPGYIDASMRKWKRLEGKGRARGGIPQYKSPGPV